LADSKTVRPAVVLLVGVLLLTAGIGAWLAYDRYRAAIGNGGAGAALIGGPFELTDQTGTVRRPEDFAGRYMLVDFGYTYCPDICPSVLLTMTEALDILAADDPEKAKQVVPIFITIDPERDTAEAMAAYAENFHPDLVALTGTPEQIAAAAKAYRVYYRKVESEDASDYLMDHSTFIYLMGPDGKYLTHFSHATTSQEMAETLESYVGA
jgi:cytochrome oxidase Cu insertion factor (SCO1/SenC/PrrC family)